MFTKLFSALFAVTLPLTVLFAVETKSAFAQEVLPVASEAPVEMQRRPQPQPRPAPAPAPVPAPKPGPREGGADD